MPETAAPVKRRIDHADTMRGVCILFVNYFHAGVSLFMLKFVASICVHPFLFMAGYFYKESSDMSVFWKKKFRTMMVPYFILGLAYYFVWLVFSYRTGEDPVNPLRAVLLMPIDGFPIEPSLYFLPVMFFSVVLFACIITYVKNEFARCALVVVITLMGNLWNDRLHMRLPMAFDCAMSVLLYFYLGFHGRKILEFTDSLVERLPRRWMRFALFAVIAAMNQALISYNYIPNLLNAAWRIIPLTHFNTCTLMLLYVYFFRFTENLDFLKGLNRILKYIGKNAILFMVFSHVALRISYFICTHLPLGDGFLFKALYCILTLLIEVPIIEVVNRSKLHLIFGK